MAGVLLIHGAWHGPWCWDAFADRLSERGHEVRAVRLRGHDGRPGRIWHRIHQYVEDVERAAADCERPPVLVGHSMGGIAAQKYLERNPASGAVLMGALAPGGVLPALARLVVRHPVAFAKATFLLRLGPLVGTSARVRKLLFSRTTPSAKAQALASALLDLPLRAAR
jgi:pimeloyl-ACP methyl ester carboxylesterase